MGKYYCGVYVICITLMGMVNFKIVTCLLVYLFMSFYHSNVVCMPFYDPYVLCNPCVDIYPVVFDFQEKKGNDRQAVGGYHCPRLPCIT